jgi:uncharacterized protein (TIGR03000 family)
MRMQFLVAGMAVVTAVAPLQAGLVPGPQLPPGSSIPPPGTFAGYSNGYYGRSYYGYPYRGYNYGYGYPSYYGGYGGVVYVAPVVPVYVPPPPVDPAPAAPVAPAAVMPAPTPQDPNVAQITLTVPADCQVWIQGVKTTQAGVTRRFVSPQLEPGKAYHYEFRFTFVEDGKETTRNEKIEVHAGDRKAFTILVHPPEVMPAPAPAAR